MAGTKPGLNGKMSQAINEFLRLNIPIFSRLKDNELQVIEKYMNLVETNPEKILFQEGDKGDYICFILDGSLDVLKKSDAGDDILIATLSKGRSLGEMAVIDELPRSATVKARTRAILLTLSRENLNYILAEHSNIGVKILKGIARLVSLNLRKTSTALVENLLPVI